MRHSLLILTGLLLICGCQAFYDLTGWTNGRTGPGGDGGGTGIDRETGQAGLDTFSSADELKQYFADMASGRNYDRSAEDGGAEPPVPGGVDEDTSSGGNGAQDPGAQPSPGDGAEDDGAGFSDTTTQEEGVQEADIVKNDGTYIYVLSQGSLRIVGALPGEQMQELAAVSLEGWGQNLYKLPATEAVATRIVAITQLDTWYWYDSGAEGRVGIAQVVPPLPPFDFAPPQTIVTVIDVSDHANPVVESTSTFEGSLANSRMIDDMLYMVVASYPQFFAETFAVGSGNVEPGDFDLDEVLPNYTVDTGEGETETGNIVEWDGVYRPFDPDGLGVTTIVTLDVNAPADFEAVAVVAYPGNLYASTEAIYLTDTDYNFFTDDYRETTDIYKFAYTDTGVVLVAAGSVEGRVLDQYSMSEYEGYLRVATTTSGRWFGDFATPSVNNLYVLGEQGEGELAVVGSAVDLAPGEEIKSARFLAQRGFLVTFERIDPLFTFDLSNPSNPIKAGELHVSGYSSFLVPMGENHLLAVGRDISLDQDWVQETGVQLSVFDVSNFADPQLLHREIIGEVGTYSEALYNPKAFTYFAAEDLLALPIESYEWGWTDGGGGVIGGGTGSSGAEVDVAQAAPDVATGFNGVYVYRVTAADGFEYLGQMSTRFEEDPYYWGSWFTRGIFLGGNVYAVNERGVVGASVSDVDSAPWRVTFPVEDPDIPGFDDPVYPEEPPAPPQPTDPEEGEGSDGSSGVVSD